MKSIAQKAEKKQRADEKKRARKKEYIVKHAIKYGKSAAARKYQESLSNIKRWCNRYDGTWQSLLNKSRRPHSHPNQHTL
ncbi:MAG: IS481 family transposase, partial [Oscillospiraceae bacterium]|nr:IS481 family transposase [Oscillospiraceae bacterium]